MRALDVANFFIDLYNTIPEGQITNLSLNKLLYFAQGHCLTSLLKRGNMGLLCHLYTRLLRSIAKPESRALSGPIRLIFFQAKILIYYLTYFKSIKNTQPIILFP